jgi:hypothetical protein
MTYLLTIFVSLFLTACPDDECSTDTAGDEMAEAMGGDDLCEEGGDVAGDTGGDTGGEVTGGEVTGGEVPVLEYTFVVVQDTSTDVNLSGTPGADICDIAVECDGVAYGDLEGSEYDIFITRGSPDCNGENAGEPTTGCLCRSEMNADCGGTDRSDEERAYDDDLSCTGDDYTSLGMGGRYTLELPALAGCREVEVTVAEYQGNTPTDESFVAALCSEKDVDLNEMMFGDACVQVTNGADGEATTFTWNNPNPPVEIPAE